MSIVQGTVFYHVTPVENLDSILTHGLRPTIGDRSQEIGETDAAVYLFPSYADLVDGLGNWLGECFDDEDELVVLEVDGYRLPFCESVGYEITVSEPISPDRIRVKEYC